MAYFAARITSLSMDIRSSWRAIAANLLILPRIMLMKTLIAFLVEPMRGSRFRGMLGFSVVFGLLGVLACGSPGPPVDSPASPVEIDAPTVLLVTVDTLRADRLGCYGYEDAGTPHIDRLAAAGTLFQRAQTTAPLTVPAHASILTGRTLPAHGVINNGTHALPEDIPTLTEALAAEGYATGAFVSSPVLARRYGLARAFDRYDDKIPKGQARQGLVVHYEERSGVQTATRALAWLADQGDKPAFLWVHLWEPHALYRPPSPFRERFPDDPYQGEVSAADDAVRRLVEGLESVGRGKRSLTIITSDHGESLGAHGESTHGLFLYREVMRVPLVFYGPSFGIVAAERSEAVSLADIAPTVLDLLAIDQGKLEGADGLSLAAFLRGEEGRLLRDGVFAESHLPQIEFGWSGLRAFVDQDYKLVDAPRRELFDLEKDGGEARNLAAEQPKVVDKMLRALRRGLHRARENAPELSAEKGTSAEERSTLQQLGYVASGRRQSDGELVQPDGVDPKDRVGFVERYDEALAMMRNGRPSEAVSAFEELAKRDPDNPSVGFQLGQAQVLAGDLEGALVSFRRAIEIDPGFSLVWYRIGQILDNQGDAEGAEAHYRQAIKTDPLSLEVRKALGSLLGEQERFREAVAVLEPARRLDPSDKAVAADLERFWARLGR